MIRRGRHAAPRRAGNDLRRFRRAIPLALAFVLAMGAVALADVVSNNVDATVDGTLEVMNLEVGGSNGSTVMTVTAADGADPVMGCNHRGPGGQVTLGVKSSNTAVATVSPSTIQFTACAPNAGSTATVTVIPVGNGSTTITLSTLAADGATLTTNSGATLANYNVAPAAFTVNVTTPVPPNTPPTVAVTGVSDGASYEHGSVPEAGCSVVDTEDGNSSFPATLSAITGPLSAYGLGNQTATCSYTDGGGLSDSDLATYTIVDTAAPTITDLGTPTGPDGANNWYVSPVTNTFSATDTGAGFVGQPNPYQFTVGSGSAEGSAVTIASGDVSDVAGNTASSIDSAAFMIDLTDPTDVTFVGGPTDGSSHYFGSVPAEPTCTANDAISGLANCTVTGYSSLVGSHTMTATAVDNAGRTTIATRSYTVLAWTIGGFYQPVDMNKLNSAKAGSTIPLKFEVFAGPTELTDTAIVKTFTQKVSCTDTGAADPIEEYATGNTSLRYDASGGQFIFNWKTPTTKGCYRVTLETLDGTMIKADFQLK